MLSAAGATLEREGDIKIEKRLEASHMKEENRLESVGLHNIRLNPPNKTSVGMLECENETKTEHWNHFWTRRNVFIL